MNKGVPVVFFAVAGLGGTATAGGLYLPGSGAISSSRAGAAVASTDSGEAIGINPSGLAKTHGTTVTLSFVAIDYAMTFQRRGTYDAIPDVDLPYEGQPYPLVEDASTPRLGIGGFQPIPVIAVTSDLGGVVPNLRVGGGIYAPNSYPFRKLCTRTPGGSCETYELNGDPNAPPNPARYDVVTREAILYMPTIAASYRVIPKLDIGARFGWGVADATSSVHVWTAPGNVVEDVGGDGLLRVTGKDNFVPSYGIGFSYAATPAIDIAGNYNSEITIDAKGTANTTLGSRSGSGVEVMVVPIPDEFAQCAPGGRVGAFKACISAQLPRSATVGGRYKFLDATGNERGDIELDVGWENWGNSAASNYQVTIDSEIVTAGGGGFGIKRNIVRHGFQDVYNARLGGSWRFPVGAANTLIARGGAAYDTAAAKQGWQRADIDGAARTTLTAGAGFRTRYFQIDAGFGVVLQGSVDNPGTCNPTSPEPTMLGCNGDGVQAPLDEREGPDPINPLVVPEQQLQAPVNQGVFESRYLMFMLGMSAWF